MNALFNIEDTLTNRISYYHISLFLISLPFDRFYSQIILISLTIHTLLHLRKNCRSIFTKKHIWLLQSVYFITVLGALYTPFAGNALNELTKKLVILILPLLLYLNPLDLSKYRKQFMLFFTLGCTAAIIYLYADAIRIVYYNHFSPAILFSALFINQNFSDPIMMHATFLSMYAALALIFILIELTKPLSATEKVIYIFCLVILCSGLLQLCSKSVCFALLLIVNIAFPWLVLRGKRRIRFWIVSLLVSSLAILLVTAVDTFHTRYFTDLDFDLQKHTSERITDPRMARWLTAIELISERPLTGFGSGSEIPLLKDLYFDKKLYSAYLHRLNAHNQYLSFAIETGIIGLSIYLCTLLLGYRQALRSGDMLFLTFIILIALVSFSENVLDVNKGIFFYSTFFTIFMASAFSSEASKTDNT